MFFKKRIVVVGTTVGIGVILEKIKQNENEQASIIQKIQQVDREHVTMKDGGNGSTNQYDNYNMSKGKGKQYWRSPEAGAPTIKIRDGLLDQSGQPSPKENGN